MYARHWPSSPKLKSIRYSHGITNSMCLGFSHYNSISPELKNNSKNSPLLNKEFFHTPIPFLERNSLNQFSNNFEKNSIEFLKLFKNIQNPTINLPSKKEILCFNTPNNKKTLKHTKRIRKCRIFTQRCFQKDQIF